MNTVVNFTNVLRTQILKAKKDSQVVNFLYAFGICASQAAPKTLMKLTPAYHYFSLFQARESKFTVRDFIYNPDELQAGKNELTKLATDKKKQFGPLVSHH